MYYILMKKHQSLVEVINNINSLIVFVMLYSYTHTSYKGF